MPIAAKKVRVLLFQSINAIIWPILVICKQINADPRWAPWNLGILICIRCSGIHRSLGTHISKVKSVDLDTWTPEQVENMLKWGNAKAKYWLFYHSLYWEHTWSGEPPENTIEQWIRAKYERKQYAMKGPVPDPDSLGDGVPTVTYSLIYSPHQFQKLHLQISLLLEIGQVAQISIPSRIQYLLLFNQRRHRIQFHEILKQPRNNCLPHLNLLPLHPHRLIKL